jgi:hypothetical protein
VAFDPGFVERVGAANEVEIGTRRTNGDVVRTIIWVVVDGGKVYVRSVEGEKGWWYRRLRRDPLGELHVDGSAVPVRAVPVADANEIERVSAALRAKYARQAGSLARMLRPETLPTTLRLEPVGST